MNRKIRRTFAGVWLASMMTLCLSFRTFAARIAFSDPSGGVGEEITVTMKITSSGEETINSSDIMLSYDPSALQFISGTGTTGDAGSLRVVGTAQDQNAKELTFSLKFKMLKAGSSTITISSQQVYDKDSQLVTIDQEGSSTITAGGEPAAEGNALLSDLQISPGNLSPSFSAEVDTYTATVGGDVEKLVVSAPPQDAGATVSITGNEGLQIGENQVVCMVTASDGQTVKTYTVTVTKVEGSVDNGLPVETDGVALKTPERLITVLAPPENAEIPEGFTECSVSIDGHDVKGWVWQADTDPQYCVFYAMNEEGVRDFYRYDLTEKTLQRYFRDPATGGVGSQEYVAMAEEYNSLLQDYNIRFWIIIGLIVISVVLLIVIIVLVATRGSKEDFFERKSEPEDYPGRAARARSQEAEDGWRMRESVRKLETVRTTKERNQELPARRAARARSQEPAEYPRPAARESSQEPMEYARMVTRAKNQEPEKLKGISREEWYQEDSEEQQAGPQAASPDRREALERENENQSSRRRGVPGRTEHSGKDQDLEVFDLDL